MFATHAPMSETLGSSWNDRLPGGPSLATFGQRDASESQARTLRGRRAGQPQAQDGIVERSVPRCDYAADATLVSPSGRAVGAVGM